MVLAEFLVLLSYQSKRNFQQFGMRGKSCFSCASIEPVHFRLHAMMHSRMVLPTQLGLQNPTIIPAMCSGLPLPRLGLQVTLASGSANECQLLKIDAKTSMVMVINPSD